MEENNGLYGLPKGWVWTTLGEVLDYVKGKKPKKLGPENERLTIPYINIRAFEHKVFTQFTDGDDCRLCEPSEVLIVWDGARCGLVGRGVSGAIGSTLAKLIGYELNSAYLFYFLQSQYGHINTRPKGVGIPHIDPNVLWNIPFPLPPISEQDRIVAKIEELFTQLDAGVAALEKAKSQLRRYRQAVLKAAVEGELTREWREAHHGELEPASVLLERIIEERRARWEAEHPGERYKPPVPADTEDLPQLPERWVWTNIGSLFTVSIGGTPSRKVPEYWNGGIHWVSSGEVAFCRIKDTREKITSLGLANSNAKLNSPGTVLLAMIGEGKTRGQVAVLDVAAANNQNVASILCSETPILPEWVFYWFMARYEQTRRGGVASGGMQPALNSRKVRVLTIALPPLPEQHRIVAEVEQRLSVADEMDKAVEQSLKRAERLRQSILKRAFEGKLVPQDPSDEPASVLLERIKAEKARREGEGKDKRKGNRRKRRKTEEAEQLRML